MMLVDWVDNVVFFCWRASDFFFFLSGGHLGVETVATAMSSGGEDRAGRVRQ